MNTSMPCPAAGGEPGTGDVEDALFAPAREKMEQVIAWARSDGAARGSITSWKRPRCGRGWS